MQINKILAEKNIKKLDTILSSLLDLKEKLIQDSANESDLDNLKDTLLSGNELVTMIENSLEEVSYLKPYLKKTDTYSISIPPKTSQIMGLTENSRSIVYIIDEKNNSLLVKKVESIKDLSNLKVYKVSKSKATKYGITYNLAIPRKILESIISNPNEQLRIGVRKNIIEIRS